jgi:threonine synthase
VKIALRLKDARTPTICLETALPAKFDETIVEALGVHAPRPSPSRASRSGRSASRR